MLLGNSGITMSVVIATNDNCHTLSQKCHAARVSEGVLYLLKYNKNQ